MIEPHERTHDPLCLAPRCFWCGSTNVYRAGRWWGCKDCGRGEPEDAAIERILTAPFVCICAALADARAELAAEGAVESAERNQED